MFNGRNYWTWWGLNRMYSVSPSRLYTEKDGFVHHHLIFNTTVAYSLCRSWVYMRYVTNLVIQHYRGGPWTIIVDIPLNSISFEFLKVLKIPLRDHDTSTFPEHGIRFGFQPCLNKAFYITMDHTNAVLGTTKDTDNTDNTDSSTSENLVKNLVNVFEKLGKK